MDSPLVCKLCGSCDVFVGIPDTTDMGKPTLTYGCRSCGAFSKVDCKILGISEEGKLQISVVPDEPKIILA